MKRVAFTILSVMFVLLCLTNITLAFDFDNDWNELWENQQQSSTEYEKLLNYFSSITEYDSIRTTDTYNYPEYFGGAYVEEGTQKLVINVTDDSPEIINNLKKQREIKI